MPPPGSTRRGHLAGTTSLTTSDPLKANFKNFLWKAWHELGLPDPTPLQYDMADYLQHGGERIIVMAFRGAAKSWVTVCYALWLLYCDPVNKKVLVSSATGKYADEIASFAFKMVMEFPWLEHMRPRADQRSAASGWDTAQAKPDKTPSFNSATIFSKTGLRATDIVVDDAEVPRTAETEGMRAALEKAAGEFAAIILPGGKIVYLGTAQTEQTLYLKLEEKGYSMRIWPIVYPRNEKERQKYGHRLAPILANALDANPELAGTSTEPSRFDEADIARRALEWGRTEFDRQFRMFLDAGMGRGYALTIRDLIVMPLVPGKVPGELRWEPSPLNAIPSLDLDTLNGDSTAYRPSDVDLWQEPEGVFMKIDPSGKGKDETTWTISAQHLGRVFLCWQGASKEGYTPAVMRSIAEDAKRWKVNEIDVESNFGQGMFGELLKPMLQAVGHPCQVTDTRAPQVQKEVRIVQTLEPLMTAHRLVVNEELLRHDFKVDYDDIEDAKRRFYRLTYQLTRMTKEKGCVVHDDRVEGAAEACRKWVGVLQRRLDESAKRSREEALKDEADKIIAARRKAGLPLAPGTQTSTSRLRGLLNASIGFGRGGRRTPPPA